MLIFSNYPHFPCYLWDQFQLFGSDVHNRLQKHHVASVHLHPLHLCIFYFTSKNLNQDLPTYFSQYYLHTTILWTVRNFIVKPLCLYCAEALAGTKPYFSLTVSREDLHQNLPLCVDFRVGIPIF
jgi:hypothetical protein